MFGEAKWSLLGVLDRTIQALFCTDERNRSFFEISPLDNSRKSRIGDTIRDSTAPNLRLVGFQAPQFYLNGSSARILFNSRDWFVLALGLLRHLRSDSQIFFGR